jgi:hypothetical protein
VFLKRKGKKNVVDVERAQNKKRRSFNNKANSQFTYIKSLLWLESV